MRRPATIVPPLPMEAESRWSQSAVRGRGELPASSSGTGRDRRKIVAATKLLGYEGLGLLRWRWGGGGGEGALRARKCLILVRDRKVQRDLGRVYHAKEWKLEEERAAEEANDNKGKGGSLTWASLEYYDKFSEKDGVGAATTIVLGYGDGGATTDRQLPPQWEPTTAATVLCQMWKWQVGKLMKMTLK